MKLHALTPLLLVLTLMCTGCGGGKSSHTPSTDGSNSPSSSSSSNIVTHLEYVGSYLQTNIVGATQPVTLIVLDQNQVPVPNIQVTVAPSFGDGSVASPTLISDSQGKVTINLTLGIHPQVNRFIANVSTSGLELIVYGIVGPLAKLEKKNGDYQIGLSGSSLTSTQLQAVDQYNNAIQGVVVTCEVTGGGGSVATASPTQLTTNSSGMAGCGTWTLGTAEGTNTLKVSAGSIFTEFYASALDMIITSPMTLINDNPAQIAVNVQSSYQLDSVAASINSSTVQLTYDSGTAWKGQLSLASYPSGVLDFTITAHDVLGHTKTAVVHATLNRKPVLTINAPLQGSVTNLNNAFISASCSDDDVNTTPSIVVDNVNPDPRIITFFPTIYAQSSTGSIATNAHLNGTEGTETYLRFICSDAVQSTVIYKKIYIDSSNNFTTLATVNGQILDANTSRILYVENSTALKIKDLTNGVITAVATMQNTSSVTNYLTPLGAIYTPQTGKTFDWDGTTNHDLGDVYYSRKNDNFFLYSQSNSNIHNLVLRNLNTQTDSIISASIPEPYYSYVASNGDVSYYDSASNKVGFVSLGGSVVWTDYSSKPISRFIWSDGANYLYLRSVNFAYSLIYDNGTTETTLTSSSDFDMPIKVNNGYIAFTKLMTGNLQQVFRRNLDGSIEQLTLFGNKTSSLEEIGSDGTVFIKSYDSSDLSLGKRYRAVPGNALEEIGSDLGKVIFKNGKALIIIDTTVLEIK